MLSVPELGEARRPSPRRPRRGRTPGSRCPRGSRSSRAGTDRWPTCTRPAPRSSAHPLAVDGVGQRPAAVDVEQRAGGVRALGVDLRTLGHVEHGSTPCRRSGSSDVTSNVVVLEELADRVGVGGVHGVELARPQRVRAAVDVDGHDGLDGVEVRQVLTGDAVRAPPVVLVAHGPERVAVAGRVGLEHERAEPDRLRPGRRRPASPPARRRRPGSPSVRCGTSGRLASHVGDIM